MRVLMLDYQFFFWGGWVGEVGVFERQRLCIYQHAVGDMTSLAAVLLSTTICFPELF